MSSENYEAAWELLKERYDNRKIIRQSHVKALLNLPLISKDFQVRALRDQVQKHLRALAALKEPVDKWDTLLVKIIAGKLNTFHREKWEDFSWEISNPTYEEMRSFLQPRAQFEDSKSYHAQGRPQISEKRPSYDRSTQIPQLAFSASTVRYPCPHCQGEHSIFSCEKFKKLSPESRYEATKKAMLCLNCLRARHRVIDCTFPACRVRRDTIHCFISKNHRQKKRSLSNLQAQTNLSLACMHKFYLKPYWPLQL